MKKLFLFSIMALALMAFVAAPSFACGEKTSATSAKADNGAKAQMVSAKSSCAATAKQASAASGCTGAPKAEMTSAQSEECLAKCGLTPEECKMYCNSDKYDMVWMNVNGMTCGGCENSVTTALTSVKGVVKVAKVSHVDGKALVVVDKSQRNDQSMTTAVADKGYEASIIPAVATMTDAPQAMLANASKACPASKSCLGSKSCAATCGSKAKTTSVSAKKTEGTN